MRVSFVLPPTNPLQGLGLQLLQALHGLVGMLTLYDPNNEAVRRLVESLAGLPRAAAAAGEERVQLTLRADEFFVNRRLLRLDAQNYDRARLLAGTLGRFGIGEVSLDGALTRASVDAFATELAQALRSHGTELRREYEGLTLGRSLGSSVASMRFEPDRLALFRVCGLLDLVEALYAKHAAGEAPSLLPLKRAVGFLADDMRQHSGIYQLMAALRSPTVATTGARFWTSVALDVVGFGLFLELPNRDLLVLGLAATLGGLEVARNPDEAVRPLLRYPGLGDLGMATALALHDARAVMLQGAHAGGVVGRLLELVQAYHMLTIATTQRAAVAPAKVLEGMGAGKVAGVAPAAAQVFAAYKGRYPLGSLVRLEGGKLGLVLAQPERPDGAERPVVALLEGATLGARWDLGAHPQERVVDTPAPADVGVDLAALTG